MLIRFKIFLTPSFLHSSSKHAYLRYGTTVNGLKIEGLSGPSGEVPGGELCIGTDDEIYGGIWRNLRKK